MNIIEVNNLQKTFTPLRRGKTAQPVEAVRGVSFEIKQGEIFGLLGPNGAGKTTTMRMLCTLLPSSGGQAFVTGYDLEKQPEEIRKNIGYLSQVGGLEASNTGRENLLVQAALYDLEKRAAQIRVKELIERLELGSFADRLVKTYSGGQKRRFDLALAVVHKPKLLFLDEPTTGLDPQSRVRVWEEITRLRQEGVTIFVTTHYLDEADNLCDRLIIIDQGKIVKEGTPSALKAEIAGDIITFGLASESERDQAKALLDRFPGVREINAREASLQLYVDNGEELLPQLIHKLHEAGMMVKSVQLSRPTLDDVFIKLTGRSLRDENKA